MQMVCRLCQKEDPFKVPGTGREADIRRMEDHLMDDHGVPWWCLSATMSRLVG
jgi:hypothetical protein